MNNMNDINILFGLAVHVQSVHKSQLNASFILG